MDVLLIEDEIPAAERMRRLLLRLAPEARVVGLLPSVRKGREWVAAHPAPALVLSDIQLSDGLSFEILRLLPQPVPIIFTTAYDEYALQAFKYNGFDYLLKPIEEEALRESLARFRQRQGPAAGALQALLEAWQPPHPYRRRFLVQHRDELLTVAADEVGYFCLSHKVTLLVRAHDGARFMLDESLEQLEANLDPAQFFRLNRQCIARLPAIRKVYKHFDGKLRVQLQPEAGEVFVSRLTAPAFKQWLNR